jgi:retron-type reverse transcriptase
MNTLDKMAYELGLNRYYLDILLSTAPKRYKTYPIEKRSGGERIIAQPSRELKIVQRHICDNYLEHLPVHEAAMAYRKGVSIKDNASIHSNNPVYLKLDFKNFFNSIVPRDWERYIFKQNLSRSDRIFFRQIIPLIFWGCGSNTPNCLSIGAPSSPLISNLVLYDFDEYVKVLCEKREAKYSRYADDITISAHSKDVLIDIENNIRNRIKRMRSPRITINEQKRGIYARGQRRMVTGLVVTPTGKISIGRERKRKISAMIHKFSISQLEDSEIVQLRGLLSFANANEPYFIVSMKRKYGSGTIESIQHFSSNRRSE